MFRSYTIESTPIDYDPFAITGILEHVEPLNSFQRELRDNLSHPGKLATAQISLTQKVSKGMNIDIFECAVYDLINRHRNLRTILSGNLKYTMITKSKHLPIQSFMSPHTSFENTTDYLEYLQVQIDKMPFDLCNGPLVRMSLVRVSGEGFYIIFAVHKMICSLKSAHLYLDELLDLYLARIELRKPRISGFEHSLTAPSNPAPLVQPMARLDYAPRHDAKQYWQNVYRNIPDPLEIATDRPRHSQVSGDTHKVKFKLDKLTVNRIHRYVTQHKIPYPSFFLSLYTLLLYRYSQQNEIVVMSRVDRCLSHDFDNCETWLPLKLQLIEKDSLADIMRKSAEQWEQGRLNSALSCDEILDHLCLSHKTMKEPLYRAAFDWVDIGRLRPAVPALESDQKLWIEISDHSAEGEFLMRSDLWDLRTIECFSEAFVHLVHSALDNLTVGVDHINLLDPNKAAEIIQQFNQTAKSYAGPSLLSELIHQSALQHPERVAVTFHNQEMTYEELDSRSSQIAYCLIEQGIRPGDVIGISISRSLEMILAMLAIIKAGAAYMPMDPQYPTERLLYMLENSETSLVISEEVVIKTLPKSKAKLCSIRKMLQLVKHYPTTLPQIADLNERHLAYVIYTSGSTGKPKGVTISHEAVVNFLHAIEDKIHLTKQDCLLAITTISFDISVLEIFLTLKVGARLVLLDQESASNAKELVSALKQYDVTFMQATPTTWRLLIDYGWKGKQNLTMICGGEAFPRDLAQKLPSRVHKVWNAYGPTEATVWATIFNITGANQPILVGRPLANYKAFILDNNLQPLPMGMAGNLYLGGKSLALGYLNRPDLTKERFIQNPFEPLEYIYDTGDIARHRDQGDIEYLFRRDNQVKLRGFRIELGEIEAIVNQHPAVKHGVLMMREDHAGEKCLVCYVILRKGLHLTKIELNRSLAQHLPSYMLPNILKVVEEIPLTANGKIDRNALPLPVAEGLDLDEEEAPSTSAEIKIAQIWAEFLDVDNISINDNFFDIGGHSILAIRVVTAINQFSESKIELRDLLTNSLRELANLVTC